MENPNPVARRTLQQLLESLHRAGVEHLPKPRGVAFTEAAAAASPSASLSDFSSHQGAAAAPAPRTALEREEADSMSPARPRPSASPPPPAKTKSPAPRASADRLAALSVLQAEVAGCRCCLELANTRHQTVFGVGNVRPRLCFFGEAPGADEDLQGEPFVGRAGQLLNKIIEACGLRREEVYILNVLKCRPPANRTPLPDEVAHCRHFFERQFEILQPEFICCLGLVAAQALLQTTRPLSQLRKTFHTYRGARVLATYHPAYLLRNPAAKKDVWEDMQLLLKEMGLPIPKKQ